MFQGKKAILAFLFALTTFIEAQPLKGAEIKTNSPATYWVSFSTHIRAGTSLPVNVRLVQPGKTSTVHVTLRSGRNYTYTDGIIYAEAAPQKVTGGQTNVINIEIPRQLKIERYDYYYYNFFIQVEAVGDISFKQSSWVNFDEKSFSVFVQTDKAIYKPGQTVKFRALAMYPNLTILQQPMDILITDPKGNGIRYWGAVKGIGNTGVVELSMPTSTQPPLGDWAIKVTILGRTETKTFTVGEYVLPRYDIKIDIPRDLLARDDSFRGIASAKYTFGKPLASADVMVTARFQTYSYGSQLSPPALTWKGKLDPKGEFSFSFTKPELKDLLWNTEFQQQYVNGDFKRLLIHANVTDTLTGENRGADATLTLHTQEAKVEFLPISATSYKPGLKYTSYVKVSKYDGNLFESPASISVQFNITVSVPKYNTNSLTTTTTTPQPDDGSKPIVPVVTAVYVPLVEHNLVTDKRVLTDSGLISFDVTIPAEARYVDIKVSVLDASVQTRLSKAVSPSNSFLQVELQSQKPQVGKNAVFSILTTEPVKKLTYQVYAKGAVLSSSEIASSNPTGSQDFTLSLPVIADMAPNCRLLVFYIRPDGEVVVDSMSFRVDALNENPVSVTFSQKKVKPGDEVDVKISAKPDSAVFILAVDKSVRLMKTGNDITQEQVSEELIGYDFGFGYHDFWNYMDYYWWPYYSRGSDAASIFSDAGVALLTDGVVYRDNSHEVYYMDTENFVVPSLPMALDGKMAASTTAPVLNSFHGGSADVAVERVRTLFPETWLWKMVLTGSSGEITVSTNAPDTITTWLATAFAVHSQYGLSVTTKTAELTTFRDAFVTLDLPYSVIRNEVFCLKAFAFNYYTSPVTTTLTLGRNKDIANIQVDCQSKAEVTKPERIAHKLGAVAKDTVGETTFCFKPTALGQLPIDVNLTTTSIPGDGVEQFLLVKPEGLLRSQSIPVLLDVVPDQTFTKVVPVQFPSNAVVGSQRITISVAGDLLGPVIKNIANLLRLPYGCAEQNMLYFAPNVYVLKYLQTIKAYTPELARTAEYYMLIGYQKEISYQRYDGSYSSFGQNDRQISGSMWLTAFVTKCFVQSLALNEPVVFIEPTIVNQSVSWIISKQTKLGYFPEPGVVFNKALEGGSGQGEALTAYILIALCEAYKNFKNFNFYDKSKIRMAIAKGRTQLENQLPNLVDSYDIAIVTYALHLVNSSQADAAFNLLQSKAVKDQLSVHWERPLPPVPEYYYWQVNTRALDIEMTAYALLTYTYRKDVSGALPIVRWLVSQRGSEGGFISTQDTVVALQALSEIAALIYSPTVNPVKVVLSWTEGGKQKDRTLTIDDSTKLLLQQEEILFKDGTIPSEITVNALTSGQYHGFAVADVGLYYNVKEITNFTTYYLPTPEVVMTDIKSFLLTVVFKRIDGKVGGMTVLQIELPTGYDLDASNPDYKFEGAKIEKSDDGTYILYYNEVGKDLERVVFPVRLISGIPVNLQPASIKLFEYYDNAGSQQATTTYELKLLKSNSVCDRVPGYECCPSA